MPRAVLVLCVLSFVLFSRAAQACQCEASFSTCKEVKLSDLVFIGSVESIEPIFLNRWNGTNQSSMRLFNDALNDAQQHGTPESLARLKETYFKMFPGLADREKKQMQTAGTTQEVAALLYSSLDRGMRVRLKVKTTYKLGDNDDDDRKDDKKDDRKKDPDSFDVWTAFGECGYDFQVGETYLVYANEEEGSNYFFTSSCMRTKRLSEAGEDLAYLFFYKNQPEQSSRLEGFATSDWNGQRTVDPLHDPTKISAPVAGVIVRLQSDRFIRYAESNGDGRFLFDGLGKGTYQLSVFASGYPMTNQLLSGPRTLAIKEKSCSRQILLLPK